MADNDDAIINRYRPRTWKEVVGNKTVVSALERHVQQPKGRMRAYLFIGPSGTGKTTMARLIAKEVGADVLELDAASNNGVEAMRELTELVQHRALAGSGTRLVILNEVHMLTRNAWNAILTILEEPPKHLYFALTTTESGKIPRAVLTRAYSVSLNPVTQNAIYDLLDDVIEGEEWDVSNDILNLIVDCCAGSPRDALRMLDQVHDIRKIEEAKLVLQRLQEEDEEALIKLCRHLLNSASDWKYPMKLLRAFPDGAFAQMLAPICGYFMGVMSGEDAKPIAVRRAAYCLDCFLSPSQTFDPKAVIYNAVGKLYFDVPQAPPDRH